MDYRQSAIQWTAAEESGRTSSVYSEYSDHQPQHLDSRNGSRTGSRHTNYTPSYMSNIAAKSTEALTIQTTQSRQSSSSKKVPPGMSYTTLRQEDLQPESTIPAEPPKGPAGLLLVLIANSIHPSTIFYLEMLLTRQHFSGILFAASMAQEAASKQLKMDVYALLGRLRQELVVAVHTKHEWSQAEMEDIASQAMKHGDGLQGVICCPEFDETGTADIDVMALESDRLERSWKQSVSFLHAAIKATSIHILARCKPITTESNGIFTRTPQGPFFLITGSTTYTSASQITKSACDTIVLQLEKSTKDTGLTVGFAESMLIREPTREPSSKPKDESPLERDAYAGGYEEPEFVAGESPTKLWSSWAMHNDLGSGADWSI